MKKCILLCLWRGYITWRVNLNQQKKTAVTNKINCTLLNFFYQCINCNFALFALTSSCLCFQSLAHLLCWNQDNCQWVEGGVQNKHLQKSSSERHPACIKQNFIPTCLAESQCHELEQLLWRLMMLRRFFFTSTKWQDPNPFISILTKLSLHFHHYRMEDKFLQIFFYYFPSWVLFKPM